MVKGIIAAPENLRCNSPNALHSPGNGHPDGMVAVHGGKQVLINLAVRAVLIHPDLLGDNPPLPLHRFLGEIGGGDKGEQQLQAGLKMLRTGEVVGRHVITGKGVGIGAQGGKLLHHVPVRHLKHLVLQVMGHPRRGIISPAHPGEFGIHGTVIGDKISALFGKPRLWHHAYG